MNAISRNIDTWVLGHSETQKAFRARASKVLVDKVPGCTGKVVDSEKLQQIGGRRGAVWLWSPELCKSAEPKEANICGTASKTLFWENIEWSATVWETIKVSDSTRKEKMYSELEN